MSEIYFRKIQKNDLNEVFILLNQLKQMDISAINHDKAWDNFINNTSSNSVVGLFNDKIIYKTRYKITIDKKLWEVDEFHKENKGLWLAEIELESENESFSLPEWIKKEVTGDQKYFNAYLSENPFKFWNNE